MWMIDVKSMNNAFDSMSTGRINPIVLSRRGLPWEMTVVECSFHSGGVEETGFLPVHRGEGTCPLPCRPTGAGHPIPVMILALFLA